MARKSHAAISDETWSRYEYMRDNGHLEYLKKNKNCEDYFAGLQWDKTDLELLRQSKRPALTINQILRTISNVMGTQIFNRTETLFKPRAGMATEDTANTLNKLFMQIGDNNQLAWVRSDVFADGIITSRGFYDVRMAFDDNLLGEVRVTQVNPKNVLLDPDSDSYDPKDWQDVVVTKWMSPNEIELLYGKDKADHIRARSDINLPYSYDSLDYIRDRFGGDDVFPSVFSTSEGGNLVRNARVVERQWKKLAKRECFLHMDLGETRPVPSDWDHNDVSSYLEASPDVVVIEKVVPRIRWTVVADDIVLYDDWSQYDCFTIVPFFPFFRRGKTIGLVENLLDAQELLNKATSQELHVINTSANSGWIVQDGNLTNMDIQELEKRGAESGLVLEVSDIGQLAKIDPNQIPTGLDRIAFKAEDAIKTISGVSDAQTGFSREDVAAKAIRANQQSGQANLAKVLDNLQRTDYILARNILRMVQTYYTDERVFRITKDRLTGETEEVVINQIQDDGSIRNDLTLGEYDIAITSTPERDNFEETQFEQAVQLRTEVGVDIPDEFLIQSSKLIEKKAIVDALRARMESPEAQKQKQLEQGMMEAELMKARAEAAKDMTDAQHNQAKTQAALAQARSKNSEAIQPEDQGEFAAEMARIAFEREKHREEMALKREEMEREFKLKEDELRAMIAIKAQEASGKLELQRQAAKEKAKQPAGAKK